MSARAPQTVKLFELRPDDGVEVFDIEAYGDAKRKLLAAVREKAASLGCDGIMIATSHQRGPDDADAATGQLNQRGRPTGSHVDALCYVLQAPGVVTEQPPAQITASATQPGPASPTTQPPVARDEDITPILSVRRGIALGVAGASVAALAAALVLGSQADDRNDQAHTLCPSAQTFCMEAARANQLIDERSTRARNANIAFGISAGIAIGAGYLWITGAPETQVRHFAVAPTLAPGQAGVAAAGTF
jgi:hypothetical protein